MIESILVANRGEIALRIIWACRDLGIRPVAVYSEADRDSLHVSFADEAVCIGPGPVTESYLNIASVIAAAEAMKVDAIHPGYGLLSENAHFAEVAETCGLTFIGPSPEHIRRMGDKAEAKKLMLEAGLPMMPGSPGPITSIAEAEEVAASIGYPVLLKAAAGGGGKGMRVVLRSDEITKAFQTASREAEANFGNGEIYMEKYLARPRHIEVQLLGDKHGNLIHLGERECSVQRKYQKLIEETPTAGLTQEQREAIWADAVRGASHLDYYSAGTMEFLVDGDGKHYFMEMNTRIQVEHPITEEVTLVDLVKEQILVAGGAPMRFTQDEIGFRGHAIECRINAEDPETLAPAPGQITAFNIPKGPGVRVDTAAHEQTFVSPFYDSMIAKVVVHGRDREEAIARMRRSLDLMVIEGIRTNIPLLRKVLEHPGFIAGDYDTHLMDEILPNADLRG
ncbi:MAG: acetyl-CoA carboxylase biotin carboxylase subunit [Acidobacteria bacterium]|nr:acetyl-CoA carboxylase biotin carboxylase subunit [Acidobacteriota bacterium]